MTYEELLQKVECGSHFKIDLVNKKLKVNHKEVEFTKNKGSWEVAEELYQNYKHSAPTSSTLGSKPYFKALGYEELSDEEIAFNDNRNIAQCKLEAYLLMNDMTWENGKHWFRKGTDKDFIVLKEWV